METASKKLTLYDIPEFVEPELSKLKILYYINFFMLVTAYLMPQYFGIDIGYDITCTRFASILLVLYVLFNRRLLMAFFDNALRCFLTLPFLAYLFVAGYTMVIRADVKAFMNVFLEILLFYILLFGIRYVIGVIKSIKIILFCSYFLGFYGILEYAVGHSLYLQFLSTVPSDVVNVYRSGHYRVMGPCGHPLGFGLLLLLLLVIACYDIEKDEIYLFKRPILLIVLFMDIFFTGSRSTLGLAVIEVGVILVLSGKDNIKKSLIVLVIVVIFALLFLFLNRNNSLGRYLMMQIASVIDTALGTRYSELYGAEIGRLDSSEEYREYLPKIFGLDWLNPIVGRGVKRGFGAEFYDKNGAIVYIHSTDNYYVSQYIKYAYPGLIAYLFLIARSIITLFRNGMKYRCSLLTVILIGTTIYFINLWWVDALQTLKFLYAYLALALGVIMHLKHLSNETDKKSVRKNDI